MALFSSGEDARGAWATNRKEQFPKLLFMHSLVSVGMQGSSPGLGEQLQSQALQLVSGNFFISHL